MKTGIISDTHNLLRPEVIRELQGSDLILHAGDISSRDILKRLEAIAPVMAVRGNNDGDWAADIPETLDFEMAGLRVCMAHRKKELPSDLSPYGLVITGHTHQYTEVKQGETFLLNPGSCGPRRFVQPITMAVAEILEGELSVRRVDIPHPVPGKAPKGGTADLRSQIEMVIRETGRGGRTVAEVAAKSGMEMELVEQIARLYVTHPGVTADGIMTKMGL